jgi:raffinose/stachyose/melibiose transport system substrate-binding protein
MKKALVFLIAAIMIVGCAACTSSPAPTQAPASAPTASSAEPATPAPTEEVTLTLWSIATESDAFHTPYVNAIADYEKTFPNVKIDFQTFENESYKPKLKAAVAANELPDIFYTWGGGFSKPFVDAGRVYAVDNVYESFRNDLPKPMLGNLTWDGKIYGASYILNVSMLFYNKKMFADAGVQPPATYEELVNVCQKFIDKDIIPFGISAKEIWVLAQTHDALTLKSVGPSTLTSVLTKDGKNSYNSPGFIDASQKFVNLVKMGAYSKDAAALTNDEAMANFYAGKQPMYIMGSWMAGNILKQAANPADFGVVPVPVLDSKNVALTDYMGGPSDSLMVSASAKNPELAAQVMFGIAKRLSQFGYLNGNGIPPWKVNYDDSAVAPLSKDVTAYVSSATSFTLWFDTLMQAEDANVYLDNLQKLYLGDLDPATFAQTVAAQLDKK